MILNADIAVVREGVWSTIKILLRPQITNKNLENKA